MKHDHHEWGKNPLVSAIIPAFNREHTITRSVISALDQTYPNIEVIVVDDGSSDGTAEVLGQFGNRIMVLEQKNGGPSQARNLGASMARGDILAFLDSDDEWHPEKVEQQVRMMQSYGPSMPCCICNATYTDGHKQSVRTSFSEAGFLTPFDDAILENPLALLMTTFLLFNQVAAIRREAFELVGGFNANLRLMEDYELSLRLATLGPWGVLREPLVLKHEETSGIGVTAMKDGVSHLAAQVTVFECILANPQLQHSNIVSTIASELRRAKRQHKVYCCMLRFPPPLHLAGGAILLIDRISMAVMRRMPGWPRPRLRQA